MIAKNIPLPTSSLSAISSSTQSVIKKLETLEKLMDTMENDPSKALTLLKFPTWKTTVNEALLCLDDENIEIELIKIIDKLVIICLKYNKLSELLQNDEIKQLFNDNILQPIVLSIPRWKSVINKILSFSKDNHLKKLDFHYKSVTLIDYIIEICINCYTLNQRLLNDEIKQLINENTLQPVISKIPQIGEIIESSIEILESKKSLSVEFEIRMMVGLTKTYGDFIKFTYQQEDQETLNLIESNVLERFARISPEMLKLYIELLSEKKQYQKIIDQHEFFMNCASGVNTAEVIISRAHKQNQPKTKIANQKKPENSEIKKIKRWVIDEILISHIILQQYTPAGEFYQKYIKQDIKSNVLPVDVYLDFYLRCILYYYNIIELKEFFKVSNFKPYYLKDEKSLLTETNTLHSAHESNLSLKKIQIIQIVELISTISDKCRRGLIKEAYKVLQNNAEAIKLYSILTFRAQEILCLIYLRKKRVEIPFSDEELLEEFSQIIMENNKFEFIVQMVNWLIASLNEQHISQLKKIITKFEHKALIKNKWLSNCFTLSYIANKNYEGEITEEEYVELINSLNSLYKHFIHNQKINVLNPISLQIAFFSITYHYMMALKSPQNKEIYLNYAKNSCDILKQHSEKDMMHNYSMMQYLICLKLGHTRQAKEIYNKLSMEDPLFEFVLDSMFFSVYEENTTPLDELFNPEESKAESKVETKNIKEEEVVINKAPKRWRDTVAKIDTVNKIDEQKVIKYLKNIENPLNKKEEIICTYNITPDLTVSSANKDIIFPIIEDNIVRINIMLNESQLSKYLTKEQFNKLKDFLQDPDKCRVARDQGQDGIKNYANKVFAIKLHEFGDLRCIGYCKLKVEANEKRGADLIIIDRVVNHKELEVAIERYKKDNIQLKRM